jgi:transketolase
VSSAIKASEILKEKGLAVNVIDMFTIKPIDIDAIYKACESKLIVSIEEHNKMGGLGAAVAEVMSEIEHSSRLQRLGVNDCFDAACDYEGLLEQNRLTPELIAEDILTKFNSL